MRNRHAAALGSAISLSGLLAAGGPAGALEIIPTFSSSITSSANAAAIENEIDYATSVIGAEFSNNVQVNIVFQLGSLGSDGLGSSTAGFYQYSYSAYTAFLKNDFASNPANTVLGTALANLKYGNDANGAKPIDATTAQLRALGVAGVTPCYNSSGAFVSGCGQKFDGVVTLSNSAPFNFTTGSIPAYNGSNLQYSALSTTEHEIDEVLGVGGSGSTLNAIYDANASGQPNPFFTNAYGVLDLYRYSGDHSPSFTTSGGASSYFSINGGLTDIMGFNQNYEGDYADWGPNSTPCSAGGDGGPAGAIQDAFSCNNVTPNRFSLASPEALALESIGYNPAAAPEPSTWAMLLLGFLGLGSLRRAKAAAQARKTPVRILRCSSGLLQRN